MGFKSWIRNIFTRKQPRTITRAENDNTPLGSETIVNITPKGEDKVIENTLKSRGVLRPPSIPSGAPKRREVEESIDRERTTRSSRTATISGSLPANSDIYNKELEKLLAGKITDEEMKKDVILFKEKIIRHRIVANITLYGIGNNSAEFKLIGFLPHYFEDVRTHWNGMLVSGTSFSTQVLNFFNKMKGAEKGATGYEIIGTPINDFHVNEIRIDMNFR